MAGMAQYWYSDFVLLRSLGENSAMCPAIFSIIILLYNVKWAWLVNYSYNTDTSTSSHCSRWPQGCRILRGKSQRICPHLKHGDAYIQYTNIYRPTIVLQETDHSLRHQVTQDAPLYQIWYLLLVVWSEWLFSMSVLEEPVWRKSEHNIVNKEWLTLQWVGHYYRCTSWQKRTHQS